MGITITNAVSIPFPIEDRPKIQVLVKDTETSPILSLELYDESSAEPARIVRQFPLRHESGTPIERGIAITEDANQVIVKIGNGVASEEDDGWYGDFVLEGPVGSIDLRDIRSGQGPMILSRPYPIHIELEDFEPSYSVIITYKAVV